MNKDRIFRKLKTVLKCALILVILNTFYFLFMVFAYTLPKENIVKNVGESLYLWENEDAFAEYPIFKNDSLFYDNNSDLLWANSVCVFTEGAVDGAIKVPNISSSNEESNAYKNLIASLYYQDQSTQISYSRYWNLAVGFLKITFQFLQIGEIRYLLYIIATTLMVLVLYMTNKIKGLYGMIPMAISFGSVMLGLKSTSLSFAPENILMLCGLLYLTYFYSLNMQRNKLNYYFLVMGSLTFAIGALVSPLIVLGMSLVLVISLDSDFEQKRAIAFFQLIKLSIVWLMGYVMTLLSKQLLSQFYLGEQSGTNQVLNWLGLEMGIAERLEVITLNITRFFTPTIIKVPIFILLSLFFIAGMLFFRKYNIRNWYYLIVFCYPVIWLLVISKHSIHIFTTHIFMISTYAMLSICIGSIDFPRIKKRFLVQGDSNVRS